MKIGLVTDSPADLPADLLQRYGIEVIPAVLILDGKEYINSVDITREEFYARLPSLQRPPTTAAPSPANFTTCYEKLFSTGCTRIISIHTAESLTSLCNSARHAGREFDGKVTVIESGSLTLGTGFQVLAAAEAASQGLEMESILERVQSTRKRVRVGAAFDTLEYLRRSGRIPAAITLLGGMMNIKPVLEVREGQIKPISAARTTRQASAALMHFLLELGPLNRLALLHTNAETRARDFLATLRHGAEQASLPAEIPIINVTSLIGTHVGPNGLGFAAEKRALP